MFLITVIIVYYTYIIYFLKIGMFPFILKQRLIGHFISLQPNFFTLFCFYIHPLAHMSTMSIYIPKTQHWLLAGSPK